MSNSEIKIEDLLEKIGIEDDNLIIVEDEEDTKKAYVLELKKALSGDYSDPELYKFYSSSKVTELVNSLKIQLSSKASGSKLDELWTIVNNITTANPDGTKDNEIIAARGSADSLSGRFDLERTISDSKYLEKIRRSTTGSVIDLNGHYGNIDISIEKTNTSTIEEIPTNVVYLSKNFISSITSVSSGFEYSEEDNGFTLTQSSEEGDVTIVLNMVGSNYSTLSTVDSTTGYFSPGTYFLYADVTTSEGFADTNPSLVINYTDSTVDTFTYNHESIFQFTTRKTMKGVSIIYPSANAVNGESVYYKNVMISSRGDLDSYVKYELNTIEVAEYPSVVTFYNNDYIYTISSSSYNIRVDYYDNTVSTEYLLDLITNVKSEVEDNIDYCGLLTDRGYYQFFDDYVVTSYPESMTITDSEEEYKRNGVYSKKITIDNDATTNPTLKQTVNCGVGNVESVTLCFYIDRPTFNYFTDADGIRVHISSDTPEVAITNYYTYVIKKTEMVQGWNFVKRSISEFTTIGTPNTRGIKTVTIEVRRNDNLNGLSFYLNSVIFNQKMKPTVIMTFDGTYDESISYLYPYLTARNIPCSLLLSSARTLTAAAFDYIIGLRIAYGWDIGMYGCNPNREILTQDDNYRNQYIALRNAKTWIQDNMIENPISYSAPYGNLRPITVPLLRDLGFKIARTEGSGYISNFSEKDFSIPVQLISNLTTYDELKTRIDYAINNNVALCLYTRDVTEYGSEADSTQLMFESVVNYIMEKIDSGELQCLTMSEFYHRCTGK